MALDLDAPSLIRVSDLMGRVIYEKQLGALQKILELNVAELTDGMYTCELIQGVHKLDAIKMTVQH